MLNDEQLEGMQQGVAHYVENARRIVRLWKADGATQG
jgi:hypothetical protein